VSVDVDPFELPLRRPLSTAHGDIDRRRGFVVRGTVDAGHGGTAGATELEAGAGVGVGEATPLPGWTESVDECRRALDLVDDLGAALGAGVLDDAPAARHAVSLALFDARARLRGESLARFLVGAGGSVAGTVPVNATVGDASVTETVDAVRGAVESGYDCVKLKVGVGDVDRDVDRLVAARAAAPDVALRADANGAWSPPEADRFVEGVVDQGLGLDYVEQPLPADSLAALAALRDSSPVRIAADETLAAASVDEVLAADAVDVVVLKPMALGGPAPTLAAAERAAEAGVESVVTTTIDAVVARTAALHVAAALGDPPACGLATGDLLSRDLAPDPAPVREGRMAVPDGPGLAGDAFATLDVDPSRGAGGDG
jgi:o-succinylbenzoate synthase